MKTEFFGLASGKLEANPKIGGILQTINWMNIRVEFIIFKCIYNFFMKNMKK